MTEESTRRQEIERFGQIREAVKVVKTVGVTSSAKRRELIIDAQGAAKEIKEIRVLGGGARLSDEQIASIPSVAQTDINQEPLTVVETAINKYLEIEEGTLPMLVDAVHDQPPNLTELLRFARLKTPQITLEQIAESIARIESGQPLDDFDQRIAFLKDRYDEATGLLAGRIAQLTGTFLIRANKSRLVADLNRNWWSRESHRYKKESPEEERYYPAEYPRSARAAFYWAVSRILRRTVGLNGEGCVDQPFVRLAIHGMADRSGFDIAVAGSENAADPVFAAWFVERLQQEIDKEELMVADGRRPKVILATKDDETARAFTGSSVGLSTFRRWPKRTAQYPPFGEKFQTLQIEVSHQLRTNDQNREQLALAMSRVISVIIEYWKPEANT